MRIALGMIGLGLLALWLGNTSLFQSGGHTRLIAHRGVHQVYDGPNLGADTCRAAQVAPITHSFVENTLPSMRAAFAAGADVVEIDLHYTDSVFAVFHDWTLDCQTNGTGVTHKQHHDTLKSLDLGYGITSDGKTFPIRGRAPPMPFLADVLEADLEGQLLLNLKQRSGAGGVMLSKYLADRKWRAQIFGVYGAPGQVADAQQNGTGLSGFDRQGLKRCLLLYTALGWSGYVPPPCRTGLIAVPVNVGPWLWGWPHRFTARMNTAGTKVILLGPYKGGGFSSGIDDLPALDRVPAGFDGYVWTNRIEIIGPALRPDTAKFP